MVRRILLVEDSELISSGLRILLESRGYEVTIAASAAAAIEWSGETAPDLVLLDLTLPDADGLEVIEGLSQRGIRPRAVVALTGHADAAMRERCAVAGCDAVLVKPVGVQELLRIVSDKVA